MKYTKFLSCFSFLCWAIVTAKIFIKSFVKCRISHHPAVPVFLSLSLTHTETTYIYIYIYINMKQIPLKSLSAGEWALPLQICMHSHRMMKNGLRPRGRRTVQANIYSCDIEEYINKPFCLSISLRNTMTETLTGACGMGLFVRPAAVAGWQSQSSSLAPTWALLCRFYSKKPCQDEKEDLEALGLDVLREEKKL